MGDVKTMGAVRVGSIEIGTFSSVPMSLLATTIYKSVAAKKKERWRRALCSQATMLQCEEFLTIEFRGMGFALSIMLGTDNSIGINGALFGLAAT
jgi:hypothetical protein